MVNEIKEKRDISIKKNNEIAAPKRRSRLMGISDELNCLQKPIDCSNFTSTSTPNKQ